MPLTTTQLAVTVLVVVLITFACRLAPFALLRGRTQAPALRFLAATMPLGVMLVLVAYTLNDVSTDPATWAPAVAGVATTAAAHLWLRRVAVSLVVGTAVYVALSLVLA